MCRSVASSRLLDGTAIHGRASRIVLSGLAAAAVAQAAFGLAHAIIIVPIWARLLGGVPFAAGAGVALAWAFDEFARNRSQSIGLGVQFGAVMFLTLLPATALEAAMRLMGLRTLDWTEVVPAVTLVVVSGAAAGWWTTRRREAALAFAVAALALMLATAGPLPVAQSARGAWLSLAIAPICLISGATLAATREFL